jgi:hypothetical protein
VVLVARRLTAIGKMDRFVPESLADIDDGLEGSGVRFVKNREEAGVGGDDLDRVVHGHAAVDELAERGGIRSAGAFGEDGQEVVGDRVPDE